MQSKCVERKMSVSKLTLQTAFTCINMVDSSNHMNLATCRNSSGCGGGVRQLSRLNDSKRRETICLTDATIELRRAKLKQ